MNLSPEEIRKALPLKVATSPAWAAHAVQNLEKFLVDHASCERKAHAAALMMVNRFADSPEIQDLLIQMAREELDHFQQVVGLLRERKLSLGIDEVDPYVKTLLTKVRHSSPEHLLDRLVAVAIIEARSCERFCLFAEALPEGPLKNFYTKFAYEESAHFPLILKVMKLYFSETEIFKRLEEFLEFEASMLSTMEIRAAVH